jgi:hypothetical protein
MSLDTFWAWLRFITTGEKLGFVTDETGEHLRQCIVYIDLNIVRTGTTNHVKVLIRGRSEQKSIDVSLRFIISILHFFSDFINTTSFSIYILGKKANSYP